MLPPTTFWFICALLALIAEFLSGTFYLLVIAIAMAGGGLAALLEIGTNGQWTIASLTGIIGVFMVSAWKRRHEHRLAPRDSDPDFGQPVRIVRLTGPQQARVHYRGTEWDAQLDADLQPGDQGFIAGRDGNQLKISSKQPGKR